MKKLTNNNISTQKGFTLIELVVVIVILGILAATAAPKFIDLTGDAKRSVMKGVQGSIESAVSMVHAKALVAGKTVGSNTVIIDSKHYALVNGYPAAASLSGGTGADAANAIGILGLLDINGSTDGLTGDFKITSADPAIIQHASAVSGASTACSISYTKSAGPNQRPVIDTSELANC